MKMDPQERENFVMLTQKALNEPDPDKFIEYLLKRDLYVGRLLKTDPQIFGGMAEEYLLRETLILERLENERKETIEKMDKLSKSRKAVKRYASKFPLLPTPAFFNKIS
jgi:hypothetical protein